MACDVRFFAMHCPTTFSQQIATCVNETLELCGSERLDQLDVGDQGVTVCCEHVEWVLRRLNELLVLSKNAKIFPENFPLIKALT